MTRRRWLWLLGIATLALFVVLAVIDGHMTRTGGPGIVGFEVAWTPARAAEILGQWGSDGQDAARLSLWLDYLYLTLYGVFFSLAIRAVRDGAVKRGWNRYARPGAVIALLPLVAAACDALEDLFLLLVLGGHASNAGPRLAASFATVKFACIGVAFVYLLGGLIAMGVTARRARAAQSEGPA